MLYIKLNLNSSKSLFAMASYNPYFSAASAHKYNDRKDLQKSKSFQIRAADRSVFKFPILTRGNTAIVYSCNGDTFVDLVKVENDAVSFKDRVSMNYEDLFGLQILIPDMINEMERGEPKSYVVNDKNNIYLMSSKLPQTIRKGVQIKSMFANIRQRYYKKEQETLSEGVSEVYLSFFI